MSFLQKLFGGGGKPERAAEPAAEAEHNGFKIVAMPIEEGGQYRLAGVVRKEVGGEMREHRLIRADTFSDRDSAATATIEKARRAIDERGDALFSD
jgi:hypothetical protein